MIIKWKIMDGKNEITSDYLNLESDLSSYEVAREVLNEIYKELRLHEDFYEGHNITNVEWEEV